jgi:hypothetical protein
MHLFFSQVYDRNTGRDEIVLDVEIVYEGDASAYFTLQVRSYPLTGGQKWN